MNWTVYTLGDLAMYRNVLNSVAMTFNSTVFASDTGAIGGAAMLTAFFIGFMLVLAGSVKAQFTGSNQNNLAVYFLLIVFWMVGIGVKERVQIEDVFSGSISAVDNVPIIVAIPASVVSTFSHRIGGLTQQTFSTTDGAYVEMTTVGFVNPLRLFLGFRNMASLDPYLAASLQSFTRDCALNVTDEQRFYAATDAMTQLLTDSSYWRNGFTTYYTASNPGGVAYPCSSVATLLNTQMENAVASGSGALVSKVLNANMPEKAPPSASTPGKWSGDDFTASAANMIPAVFGGSQTAQDAMKNMLAAAYVSDVFKCKTSAFDAAAFAQCTNLSTEQDELYRIDATTSASFFSRLMMPAMTILSALFFALAPLVVFVALMANFHGIGLMVKYLLFGAWTQSFLPVAHVLNYFIQYQFRQAMEGIAASGMNGVTPGNVMDIYHAAMTKVAFASDLMAATPLITLMLFTGSYYALTSIAQRISGRDNVEERQVIPQVAKQEAMASLGGAMKAMSAGAVASGASLPEYSRSNAASASLSSSLRAMTAASDNWGNSLSSAMNTFSGGTDTRSNFQRFAKTSETGSSSGKGGASKLTSSLVHGDGTSAQTAKTFEGAVRAMAAMGVDAKIAKAGLEGVIRKSGAFTEAEQKTLMKNLNDSKEFGEKWEEFKRDTTSNSKGNEAVQAFQKGWRADERASFDKTTSELHQRSKDVAAAQQVSQSADAKHGINAAQLVDKLKQHGYSNEVRDQLAARNIPVSENARRAVDGLVMPEDRELAAAFHSLYMNPDGYQAAADIITRISGFDAPKVDGQALEKERPTAPEGGVRQEVEGRLSPPAGTPKDQPAPSTNAGLPGRVAKRIGDKPPAAPAAPAAKNDSLPHSRLDVLREYGGGLSPQERADFHQTSAAAMETQFRHGLPAAMGEYVGDVTKAGAHTLIENPGYAAVFAGGAAAGTYYKLNNAMKKAISAEGGKPGSHPFGNAIKQRSAQAFSSAKEATAQAAQWAKSLPAGENLMVVRQSAMGLGATASVGAMGYMIYQFNEKAVAGMDKDAKSKGFGSGEEYVNQMLNPATSTFRPNSGLKSGK